MSTIHLSWAAQSGATQYNIYRDVAVIDHRALPAVHLTTTTPDVSDTGLSHGDIFYYVIEAVNIDGERLSISKNRAVACLENVYVADSTNVHKIDVTGTVIWSTPSKGNVTHIECDNSGSVYYSTSNGFVTKLDHEGSELWSVQVGTNVKEILPMTNRVHALVNDSTEFTTSGFGLKVLNFSSGDVTNSIEHTNESVAMTSINGESIVVCDNGRVFAYNQNGSQLRTGMRSVGTSIELSASDSHLYFLNDGTTISKASPVNFLNSGDEITRTVTELTAHKDGTLYFLESGEERNVRQLKTDGYNGWGNTVSNATMLDIDTSGNILAASNSNVTLLNNKGIPLWSKDLTNIQGIATEPGRFWI